MTNANGFQRALRLADRLIPAIETLDEDSLRQARLFAYFSLVVTVFGSAFGLASATLPQLFGEGGGVIAAFALGGSATAALNVALGPRLWPQAATRTLVAIVIGVLGAVPFAGPNGFWEECLWFKMLVPLVCVFLVSARFAVVGTGVVLAEITVLYVEAWNAGANGPGTIHVRYLAMTTSLVLVTVLAWAYELARKEAQRRLDIALSELRDGNVALEQLAKQLEAARDRAEHDSRQKSIFLDSMRQTAREQGEAIDETSAAMAELTATFRAVKESVATLAKAANDSGKAAQQIHVEAQSTTQQILAMVAAVDEAAAALEQMSASVKDVAERADHLSSFSEEASAAMNQMHTSIAHVAELAQRSEQLASEVRLSAEAGALAVERTRTGVHDILSLSRAAGDTIRTLSQRIQAIGGILDVIQEVAAQTQLLSLNAAILASQAGEHGLGFSVVAGQIKELATRTQRSTDDIAVVIQGVQEESRRAVQAIKDGERAANDGVARSREAEQALEAILRSAEETAQAVVTIVAVTSQQTTAVREVARASEELAATAASIAAATEQQAGGADVVLQTTRRISALTREVERASREQAMSASRVEKAAIEVDRMAQQLARVQDDQVRGGDQIHKAMEAIGLTQEAQLEAIATLDLDRTTAAASA